MNSAAISVGIAAFALSGLFLLTAPRGASCAGQEEGGAPPVRDGGPHAHDGHDGHDHGKAAPSDLDRSIGDLWKARCEHDVLQYTCDECRYGLGVVRLDPSLFGEGGKGGLIAASTVGSASYTESRVLNGEVGRSEGRTVHVTSPLPGIVRSAPADLGTAVRKGDLLFEIDSHEVFEAKADYLKRSAGMALARKTAEREARLFEKKISSEAEVLEAKARLAEAEVDRANARARLLRLGIPEDEVDGLAGGSPGGMNGLLAVSSPRDGIVLEKHVSVGERVDPGKDLLTVADLSEVWVWAALREGDLPAVASGRNGEGTIPAEVRGPGGRTYRGILDVLSGAADEGTRTVRARVVVANPDGSLRPGMFVTLRLLLPGGKRVLAVPREAVLADEGRSFVFVHKEGDYWVRRPVVLGRSLGNRVEVRRGLSAGQRIIADGSFVLKSDVLRGKMGAGCAD